ncbi:MAG: agmatine deiminase [Candidatus Pelagadaptatus aseana]|uniref:agmatine deiminase n=1 Tax=Candidatus Pelagadaptatus aseana TaxID=3120508 RepID=UPI0039B2306F
MSETYHSRPRTDGFYMPGEHEPQQTVLMVWPQRPDSWRLGAKPAQTEYVEVAKAIAEVTPVTMCVSAEQYSVARRQLPEHIQVVEMSNNDSWMRDTGPSYVVNGKGDLRGVDWEFNAWGGLVDGLFFPWDLDDQVACKVLEMRGENRYRAPLILEGGSIHVDGEGTCYTTEECLLHPSRNPDLSKQEIESLLQDYLNVDKVVWLKRGLYHDETNGHIDNILHVARPGEVILSWCDDEADPMYDICREGLALLEATTDARGRAIKVHKLPIPGPLYMTEEEAAGIEPSDSKDREAGERLGGSYANFLITNGRIICPQLDPDNDEQALAILARIFPDHEVVGVKSREILLGGGNIHCITQQVPAV